jgi:hypothetical protein
MLDKMNVIIIASHDSESVRLEALPQSSNEGILTKNRPFYLEADYKISLERIEDLATTVTSSFPQFIYLVDGLRMMTESYPRLESTLSGVFMLLRNRVHLAGCTSQENYSFWSIASLEHAYSSNEPRP